MGWVFFRHKLAGVCVPCYQPSCLSCFQFAMICNIVATRSWFISGKDDNRSVTSAPDMNTISVGSLVQKFYAMCISYQKEPSRNFQSTRHKVQGCQCKLQHEMRAFATLRDTKVESTCITTKPSEKQCVVLSCAMPLLPNSQRPEFRVLW